MSTSVAPSATQAAATPGSNRECPRDSMTRRILLVDDDPTLRTSIAEALADDGFAVAVADGGAQALASFEDVAPDVVLSDVRMDDIDGLAELALMLKGLSTNQLNQAVAYGAMQEICHG